MKGPVLVLGATSLIGRFLSPLAGERSLSVIALTRASPEKSGLGDAYVWGDLADPDLAESLPDVATVLSLSPIWLLPQALPALHGRGMRRLVAISSTSRSTKRNSPHPEERAVARRLADSEASVIAFCAAHGVAWTILRPTLIYAEGQDRNVSRLAALIRRVGVVPISGQGNGRRQPVHAADLASAALDVAECPSTEDRAYDLPGAETLSYRTMVERIFEGLGRRPRILVVPPLLWRLGLRLAAPLLPGATAAMGDRMAEDLVFDAEPARRDFGWSPRPFRPRFAA